MWYCLYKFLSLGYVRLQLENYDNVSRMIQIIFQVWVHIRNNFSSVPCCHGVLSICSRHLCYCNCWRYIVDPHVIDVPFVWEWWCIILSTRNLFGVWPRLVACPIRIRRKGGRPFRNRSGISISIHIQYIFYIRIWPLIRYHTYNWL